MEQRLEAVLVPVTDIDRIRHFYRALGFRLDLDQADCDGRRMVQLTPPGSSCSIVLGTWSEPGSATGVLAVTDLDAAVAELRSQGVAPSAISRREDGYAHASFRDPDGNLWLLLTSDSHWCDARPDAPL
jgi:catechol 2,3-dioxygenase-like lactoylglutathione lyase family enzyme